ncbi:MAG: FKBP-type peptidyl-prolyl cis-trans isomerase [Acidimicrobiia bacterium]
MRRSAALFLVFTTALATVAGITASAAGAAEPLASVTVNGDVAAKPRVTFAKPFAVKKTIDKTVTTGTGAALASGQTVTFDYLLVDGRTGKELETSYGKSPGSLVLDQAKTATQLVTSLTGQTIGSRVLVAIAPKDGLAKRLKSAKVKKDDTLLFVIDVKGVRTPLSRATGDAVTPAAGLPTVVLAADGKPTITIPQGVAAPTTLVSQVLIKGTGPVVTAGQTISVQYTGVIWGTGKQFDSSWDRGQPFDVVIGKGNVVAGWDEGLVGQTVGSQVLLVIPPDKGYGSAGQSSAGISGTDTLVFVVDILDVY